MSTYFSSVFYDIINSRRRLYWLLQTVGWFGYAFFVLAGAAFWDKADSLKVIYTIIAAVLGLLISMAMRQSFLQVWEAPALRRSIQTIVTVMLSTAVWAFWKYYEMIDLYKHKEIENFFGEYVYWYSYSFFILLSWTGLYYGIRFYQEMQAEREKNLRIATSAHQSQLKMLRYQLNPHFLFNTLNAISTLIMENKGTVANDMVSALSRFLRYSLDNDPMQKVNLAKEVKAMQLYLGIEKIRFEERLKLNFELEEDAKQALVPSMLL
ncbi:MAG: sensor histidine kinase [Gammaproteobacteria bacterium]|nr:sensor histidine kinase [Gammaproteobacteria bacterium]